MRPRIVIIGAGGHAAVIIEALRAGGNGTIEGILSSNPDRQAVLGVGVLGDDSLLPELWNRGVRAAVVAIGDNDRRQARGRTLQEDGFELLPVVHPAALISPSATIASGAVVMARAVVGTRARIGPLAIINTGAIVEHDTVIDAAAHVAPGAALAGGVHVGERALIGVGSVVRPGVRIGVGAVIGAGAAVVHDIPDGAVAVGVPARVARPDSYRRAAKASGVK